MRTIGKNGPLVVMAIVAGVTAQWIFIGTVKLAEWSSEKYGDWKKKRALKKAAKEEIVVNRK